MRVQQDRIWNQVSCEQGVIMSEYQQVFKQYIQAGFDLVLGKGRHDLRWLIMWMKWKKIVNLWNEWIECLNGQAAWVSQSYHMTAAHHNVLSHILIQSFQGRDRHSTSLQLPFISFTKLNNYELWSNTGSNMLKVHSPLQLITKIETQCKSDLIAHCSLPNAWWSTNRNVTTGDWLWFSGLRWALLVFSKCFRDGFWAFSELKYIVKWVTIPVTYGLL